MPSTNTPSVLPKSIALLVLTPLLLGGAESPLAIGSQLQLFADHHIVGNTPMGAAGYYARLMSLTKNSSTSRRFYQCERPAQSLLRGNAVGTTSKSDKEEKTR